MSSLQKAPQKGYIRWWAKQVMDWDGDCVGQWEGDYPNQRFIDAPFEDKPYAQEFSAKLTIGDSFRGRSAAGFTFIDESGTEHTMRLSNLAKLMKSAVINKGSVSGVWAYAKQGANFSLKYVREEA